MKSCKKPRRNFSVLYLLPYLLLFSSFLSFKRYFSTFSFYQCKSTNGENCFYTSSLENIQQGHNLLLLKLAALSLIPSMGHGLQLGIFNPRCRTLTAIPSCFLILH